MVRRNISRKKPGFLRLSLWLVFGAIVIALFSFIKIYRVLFSPSVKLSPGDSTIFFVPTGSDYQSVLINLKTEGIIKDPKSFKWLAQKKNYPSNVHPGRYRITGKMSNNDLLNMLRSGKQEPLMVTFNNLRTIGELADVLSSQLEPDSAAFARYFRKPETVQSNGFTMENFAVMFIPNSYEFYWNTSPEEYVKRMKREYIAFWSKGRMEKAQKIGLKPEDVSILASIVEQESLHNDENSLIAGVFINRLKEGIPLQSDPTLIFALHDFNIRRVLNLQKKIDSPYNTYKNRGLPPGPICIPSISAIDAVLNYEAHRYLYFCAKPDFSGYHNFAQTLAQHNKNARLYQQALNRRKIFK